VFGCEYAQTYGMTETSPYLTLSLLHGHLRALPAARQLIYKCKTGRPFKSIELKVIDDQGRPVPPNGTAVGEILVRGPTVTPGYWNQPDATAAAFVDGWLCTGDLATLDSEGYVNIVDRKKDVILSGGETIYSTEVENVLYAHPAVVEAAVFGRPDELWGEAVCAAVVTSSEVTSDQLRAHCREHLAGFKLPRHIAFLESLPRTGSGKIAKRMLRDN
jgi:acyl-CoA synthetase (AMP-forming)/AMP-acid ligase II